MSRTLAVISAIIMACFGAGAQNFQRYNLNYEDLGRYNPAASAEAEKHMSIMVRYTLSHAVSYGEDPLDLAFDLMTGNDKGRFMLGGTHDASSFFERYYAYLGYAWRVQLSEGWINVGARVNLAADRVDLTSLGSYDGGRDRLTFIGEDWDLGLEYRRRGLHMGFAVQNIMASRSEWESITFLRNPRTFVANISYDMITRGEGFQFTPFILAGYSRRPILDVGAFISIARMVNVSYAYRLLDAEHIVAGRIPVPGSSFSVRGAYGWSFEHRTSEITAGILYNL